jgi:hypothetical protein
MGWCADRVSRERVGIIGGSICLSLCPFRAFVCGNGPHQLPATPTLLMAPCTGARPGRPPVVLAYTATLEALVVLLQAVERLSDEALRVGSAVWELLLRRRSPAGANALSGSCPGAIRTLGVVVAEPDASAILPGDAARILEW